MAVKVARIVKQFDPATMESPPRLIARGVVRVSDVGDRDEIVSPDSQLRAIRDYCNAHNLELDEAGTSESIDLDESGFHKSWRERQGMLRHYEAAKRGEFQVLVSMKLSRYGRRTHDILDMVQSFNKQGVSIRSADIQLDTSNAQGRMMLTMLAAVSEMEAENISEFVRKANMTTALKGKWPCGRWPQWLDKAEPGSDYQYTLNYSVAEGFRRMVQLRVEGKSYLRIAQILNAEGYLGRNGVQWTGSHIAKYFSSDKLDAMRGIAYYGRNMPDGVAMSGVFEPLLTEEEFAQLQSVQALFLENPTPRFVGGRNAAPGHKNGGRKSRYNTDSPYLLAGLCRCPACGGMLTGSTCTTSWGLKRNYYCARHSSQPGVHDGLPASVTSVSVDEAALRVLSVALMRCDVQSTKPKPKPNVDSLQNQLATLGEQRKTYIRRNAQGMLDEAMMMELLNEVKAQEDHVRDQIQRAAGAPADVVKAQDLIAQDTISREQLRMLALYMVERVEGPYTMPSDCETFFVGEYSRTNLRKRKSARQYVLVTLKAPLPDGSRVFVAPLYRGSHEGLRFCWPLHNEWTIKGLTLYPSQERAELGPDSIGDTTIRFIEPMGGLLSVKTSLIPTSWLALL